MPDRRNPFSYKVLGNITLGSDPVQEAGVINDLIHQVLNSDRHREGWLQRQRAHTKLRFGIKQKKTFPWKDASNLNIPLTDNAIRKWKPGMLRLVVEPDPVVEFVGEDPEAVEWERRAEAVYNWLWKTEMEAIEPIAYLLDIMAHRGIGFLHIQWDWASEYETASINVADLFPQGATSREQVIQVLSKEYKLYPDDPRVAKSLEAATAAILQGEPWVKLAFQRVIRDRPSITDLDPVQVIAPARTTDFPNAEWLTIQHVISRRKVEQKEADGLFMPGSTASIVTDIQRSALLTGRDSDLEPAASRSLWNERALQDQREKIWGVENEDNILLWQVYHWHDYNGDGLKDRVETWLHPRSQTKLSSRPYPYPFHEWPIEKFDFEKINRRWHSPRGISEMLKDLQIEVNVQHNSRLDAMALRNAPVYQQLAVASGFKARNFRATPGTVIQGARLEPLQQDRGAFPEQINEENLLRGIAEQYIGIYDANITSPQSQTRARTATEIQAVVQYQAATATMDAILFQLSMRRVHLKVWQLFMAVGPQEIWVKVAGQDQTTNEPRLTQMSRADLNRRFKLIPTGTVANTNRAIELSNAREALNFFVNDQSGYIKPGELRKWYLMLSSEKWYRRILNSPQEAQELVTLRQAAQALKEDPRIMAAMQANRGLEAPPEPDQQELAQSGQYGSNNGL